MSEVKLDQSEIQKRVIDTIAIQLGVDQKDIKSDSRFADDLGADSLDIVELMMVFEEKFGIELPDEDIQNIRAVNDLVLYIDNKLNKNS